SRGPPVACRQSAKGAGGYRSAAGRVPRSAGLARTGRNVLQADCPGDRRAHRHRHVAPGASAETATGSPDGDPAEGAHVNCREIEALLPAYVDEELDLVHSLEVEAHLQECRACASRVQQQRTVRHLVSEHAPYFTAP